MTAACQACGAPIEQAETGRPRQFCSDRCRQRVRKPETAPETEIEQPETQIEMPPPVIPHQGAIDVYLNAAGQVVIREQDGAWCDRCWETLDACIAIDRHHVATLLDRVRQIAEAST